MAVETFITDSSSKKSAEVNYPNCEKRGLVVYQERLKTFENDVRFFLNDTYGADLNQNVTTSGTSVGIHDGIDHAWWTAAALSGTWVFNSATQKYDGAASIDASATVSGNVATFTPGAGSQNLTGYSSIEGYIYLSAWDQRALREIRLYGWNITTATIVGVVVNIGDYIDINSLGSWQKFLIPLNDMGLSGQTINQLRLQTYSAGGKGGPPDYYIDLLFINEIGSPLEYYVEPVKGTWLHVDSFNISFADAYSATVASGTMPCIPYDGFFGVSGLSSGVTYRRIKDGAVKSSATIKKTIDLTNYSNAQVTGYGSDGTNSWASILIKFSEPIVLKPENNDKMVLTISEDLSGLLYFRVAAACKVEERPLCSQ